MNRSNCTNPRSRAILALVTMVILLPLITPCVQAAGKGNPGILPPKSHPFGLSYREWSARWWQHVFSIPAAENPLLVDDKCGVGQEGKVWFLTGKFCLTGGPECQDFVVERSCSVPSGKALFFPVANAWCDNLGVDPPMSEQELRECASGSVDTVISMEAEIDGMPIKGLDDPIGSPFRVGTKTFDYSIPEGNLFDAFGFDFPPQVVQDAVGDGVYLMVSPLSVGHHTIRFAAAFENSLSFDVTYHILVTPPRNGH